MFRCGMEKHALFRQSCTKPEGSFLLQVVWGNRTHVDVQNCYSKWVSGLTIHEHSFAAF
jgi:hypothetical protein